MAIELGAAYISILPETSKLAPNVKNALRGVEGEAAKSGERQGSRLAAGLGKTVKAGLKVAGIGGAIAGAFAIKGGIQSAMGLQDAEATLKGLYGSGSAAADMMDRIKRVASTSPIDHASYADAATSLAYLGIKGSEAEGIMGNLGNAIVAAGGSGDEMQSATLALTKMQNEGRVGLETINMLSESGIPIFDALSSHFGVSVEELRKMISEGAVGIEDVMGVIERGEGKWFGKMDKAAKERSKTFSAQWAIAKDNISTSLGQAFLPLLTKVTPWLGKAGSAVDTLIQRVSKGLDSKAFKAFAATVGSTLVPALQKAGAFVTQSVLPRLKELGGWVKENLLPVLISFGKWFINEGVPRISSLANKIATDLVPVIRRLGEFISNVLVPAFMNGIVPAAKSLFNLITSNKGVVYGLVTAFVAWKAVMAGMAIAAYIKSAGSLMAALGKLTGVTKLVTAAKAGFNRVLAVGSRLALGTRIQLAALWVQQKAIAVWSKIVTAAQWLWNAALTANPIGLVIAAIAGLIAVVVLAYKKNETFRKVINKVWAGIKKTIGSVWGWMKGVFNSIKNWVVKTLPKGFNVLKRVGAVVFKLIRLYIKVWWTVASTIFKAAIKVVKAVGAIFKWLWNKAIKPAFAGIKKIIAIWWRGAKRTFELVRKAVGKVGDVFKWLYNKAIKPAMNSIKNMISNVWNRGIRPIFEKLRSFVTKSVVPGFRKGIDKVKSIWDGLKAAAKKPVQFLVNTVYMKGIRGMMNKIPGVNLPSASFAKGGVMPGYTPGRDVHHFSSPTGGNLHLSGGEAIMRPEFTRMVGGRKGVETLNRLARLKKPLDQRFARGGVVMPLAGARLGTYAGHDGVDLNVGSGWDDYRMPVRAFRSGTISYTGWGRGYGNAVFQRGPYGEVVYGHFDSVAVSAGQKVSAGDFLGRVGNTGNSSAPHVHFGYPGGSFASAVALLNGARNIRGGSVKSAAQRKGEKREEKKKSSWLDAIKSLPGNAKSMWSDLRSMGSRFGPWGTEFKKAGLSGLRGGANWVDNKIPDKLALKFLPDVDLPNTPVMDALKKLGIFDNGGILEPGKFAYNASNKPEAVFNQQQFKKFAEGGRGGREVTPRRVEMVITNWDTGEGYMREIARDEVDSDYAFSTTVRGMGR